jgi:NAD dependent epimerase/dehydratase family enzyme
MLAKQLHRPFWLSVPAFGLKGILGEMSTLVLDGQKVIPARLSEANFDFEFPGLETALKDLLI